MVLDQQQEYLKYFFIQNNNIKKVFGWMVCLHKPLRIIFDNSQFDKVLEFIFRFKKLKILLSDGSKNNRPIKSFIKKFKDIDFKTRPKKCYFANCLDDILK